MTVPLVEFCDDLDAPAIGVIMHPARWERNRIDIETWFAQQGIDDFYLGDMLIYIKDPNIRIMFILKWCCHGI